MPGYWRNSGSQDQPRKGDRADTASDGPDSRRHRRVPLDIDDDLDDADSDEADPDDDEALQGHDPGRFGIKGQPEHLPAAELSEEVTAARGWKERIDREVTLAQLARLPDFGPAIADLPPPVIAPAVIHRPWMDPDDPVGAAAARSWSDLGYSVQVKGNRTRYARAVAYLLREQLTWAKVEKRTRTADGMRYRVRTGLIGENGRHAVLVSEWTLRPGAGPELVRAWPEPLPALPPGRF